MMWRILGPVMLVAMAGGAHWFITTQLKNQVHSLQHQVEQLQAHNTALEVANSINQQTIQQLEQVAAQQNIQITRLIQSNNQIAQQRDEYLSIFRRHDLTQLSRARPGLIEPRINQGTQDVFDQLEEDTQP